MDLAGLDFSRALGSILRRLGFRFGNVKLDFGKVGGSVQEFETSCWKLGDSLREFET